MTPLFTNHPYTMQDLLTRMYDTGSNVLSAGKEMLYSASDYIREALPVAGKLAAGTAVGLGAAGDLPEKNLPQKPAHVYQMTAEDMKGTSAGLEDACNSAIPDLPDSSEPYKTIWRSFDPNPGNYTGADGSTDKQEWAVTTDLGFVLFYNADGDTPIRQIDTGVSGLSGIAKTQEGYVLSAGTNLYVGKFNEEGDWSWIPDTTYPIIGLTGITSDITDVDAAFETGTIIPELGYSLFIATQGNGIRMVTDITGATTSVESGNNHSIDIVELDGYCAMRQRAAESYHDMNSDGTLGTNFDFVNLNPGFTPEGVAYFQDSQGNKKMAVVHEFGFKVHNTSTLSYVDVVKPVPPPAPDDDGDGIINSLDECLNTVPGAEVDITQGSPTLGCPIPDMPYDLDDDGDIDGLDVAGFEGCSSGPAIAHPESYTTNEDVLVMCADLDFDSDGDIDQSDFGGGLQVNITGTDVPFNPKPQN